MKALFIGHTYVDITFVTDHIPEGDEKTVARDYAVAFGGNAVTAAFACAKLGIVPDLLSTVADDWLGRMFMDMALAYRIPVHARKVARSSLSFIMPNDGKRAIVRCRDDAYLHPFPMLNLDGCELLHLDGHQGDASIAYARLARERGMLVSLDGGGVRSNTLELLPFVDVAIVSERFCEQLDRTAEGTLDLLREKGVKVGGVTQGERGLLWYEGEAPARRLAALQVPEERVIDTNGAGDLFHGAYVYARLSRPQQSWDFCFRFARAASAYGVQFLGNEARLPRVDDVFATAKAAGDVLPQT
ncbi:MAG: sugar kinase [Alphaproteobacteria bacterium]|nr:sugar kinase [Alphaproteobacteria bacterium]